MNKQYKDKFGYIHEVPTKENEVKKFNSALKEAMYLANMGEKPSTSNYADMPKTFIDEYNERRRKNSEEQKQIYY